jgi:hypothetical protein
LPIGNVKPEIRPVGLVAGSARDQSWIRVCGADIGLIWIARESYPQANEAMFILCFSMLWKKLKV